MLNQLDATIIEALNRFAGRSPAFDMLIADIGDSALLKGGVFMAFFWWSWFNSEDRSATRRQAVIVGIIGALAAALMARLLQLALPFHDRPIHSAFLSFTPPAGVNAETLNHWSSFPSDHAVLFFALSTAVWYESRILGVAAAVWTLVVVCLPRLYLGYHYPSDIVGGAVIGFAIMTAVRHLLLRSSLPGRVVRWGETHAAFFYCAAFVVTYELTLLFYDLRQLAADGYHVLVSMAKMLA
jgi:undecaprenyl-diphosphatase